MASTNKADNSIYIPISLGIILIIGMFVGLISTCGKKIQAAQKQYRTDAKKVIIEQHIIKVKKAFPLHKIVWNGGTGDISDAQLL